MSSVRDFINLGAVPRFDRDGNGLVIGIGRRFTRLTDPRGTLTAAGQSWEAITGQSLPASGTQNRTPFRAGNTEYIRLARGHRGALRRYNPATNSWDFTALGRRYYMGG